MGTDAEGRVPLEKNPNISTARVLDGEQYDIQGEVISTKIDGSTPCHPYLRDLENFFYLLRIARSYFISSYLPNENTGRPPSFKPDAVYVPNNKKFAEETIYKESYQNAFDSFTPTVSWLRNAVLKLESRT